MKKHKGRGSWIGSRTAVQLLTLGTMGRWVGGWMGRWAGGTAGRCWWMSPRTKRKNEKNEKDEKVE